MTALYSVFTSRHGQEEGQEHYLPAKRDTRAGRHMRRSVPRSVHQVLNDVVIFSKTCVCQHQTLDRCTCVQEAQLDSDDEPGGLHIGSAVIYRAPLSSRKTARLPSSSRQRRTCTSCVDTATASTSQVQHNLSNLSFDKSDDSLDEELRDYLDNLKQVPV